MRAVHDGVHGSATRVRRFRGERSNEIALQSRVLACCAGGGHGSTRPDANAAIHIRIKAHDVATRLRGVHEIGGVCSIGETGRARTERNFTASIAKVDGAGLAAKIV